MEKLIEILKKYNADVDYYTNKHHIDEELFPDEMHDFLKTALSLLSKEDLDLIMLKYKYKMNSKSIGNIYEISDAYVRVRLHRIRDYLKKQILIQQENNNK